MLRANPVRFSSFGSWIHRAARIVSTSVAVLSIETAARAQGISGPGVVVEELRVALADNGTTSTTWMQAKLQQNVTGAEVPVVWTLAIPPSTSVDIASSSWLDALEAATAPRVKPLEGPIPNDACAIASHPDLISSGDCGAVPSIEAVSLANSQSELDALATPWGVSKTSLEVASGVWSTAGTRVLAIMWHGGTSTMSIRLQGPGRRMPRMRSLSTPTTMYLIGDTRLGVVGLEEREVSMDSLRWLSTTSTTYASERSALTASLLGVVDSSDTAMLSRSTMDGTIFVESAIDGYLRRAFDRGEATGDEGQVRQRVQTRLGQPSEIGTPCARGDLVSAVCTPGAGASATDWMAGQADDLAFAFAGGTGPANRWVTRITAQARAASFEPLITKAAESSPVIKIATYDWDALCPTEQAGAGGAAGSAGSNGTSGSSNGGAGSYVPVSGAAGSTGESTTGEDIATGIEAAGVIAQMADGCSCGSGTEEPESDDEASSCSGDSSSDSSGDSCSSSGGDSSGDSCSSSGGESSESGCSSGSPSSEGSSQCTVSRRTKRRSRLSPFVLALAAIVLPLRRMGRKESVRT